MPLYDCTCKECGKKHNDLLLKRDEEPPACDECGGDVKRDTAQNSNFALKGKGWFKDGY